MTFLLRDPGWCVHIPDVQNIWDANTHTHISVALFIARVIIVDSLAPGLYQDVCVCVFFPFIVDVRLVSVPAGVTQEEGHTGFLIQLPSAVLALIFLPRRIQPFLSLVDREVEFCVLTI